MNNNKVRIKVENGIDLTFRFSDIVGLKYGNAGFHAIVILDGRKIKIPVTYKSFSAAVLYIAEHVGHCKECGYRLLVEDVYCEGSLLERKWLCPKCNADEN